MIWICRASPFTAHGAALRMSGGSVTRSTSSASLMTSSQFYAPGPIIDAEILQPAHPIFYGYARTMVPVRYASGPLLSVEAANAPSGDAATTPVPPQGVLMRYPGGDEHVLSGFMRGA